MALASKRPCLWPWPHTPLALKVLSSNMNITLQCVNIDLVLKVEDCYTILRGGNMMSTVIRYVKLEIDAYISVVAGTVQKRNEIHSRLPSIHRLLGSYFTNF